MRRKTITAAVSVCLIAIFLFWFNRTYLNVSPTDIQQWIQSIGWWGPLLFIVIYAFRPIILFPASILSIAGGLAFGAIFGFIYTMIGAVLSAIVAYLIARRFNHSFIKKIQDPRVQLVTAKMEEKGFLYVLLLRLAPLLNFDLVSYSAGLANVKLKAFTLATIIGILPGTFGYIFLGSSLAEGDMRVILLGLTFFVVVITIPIIFRKRMAVWLGLQKEDKKE
ncbi:TVP38/TMEM64 family protein [Jeotgalibacillus haloalkalitolerans]|uniref:TVP38/TMEM64 family membrane protein n=1 Tax=Jeotgalibacillus haloalkalitolerans TaxID=3104292 RepID=A0ABU5KPI8_9BACL|nr:TVP38/TMEM64 family protein [Jeotgalibacillus sp. HH7-29]MDZ5713168.1 TVP38/TMEM64 family protein [Jeotgalibacillus sp. HH7-29]